MFVQAVRENYRLTNQAQETDSNNVTVESNQLAAPVNAPVEPIPVADPQAIPTQSSANDPVNGEAQPIVQPKKKGFLQKFNEKLQKVNQVLDQANSKTTRKATTTDPNAAQPAQTNQSSNAPAAASDPQLAPAQTSNSSTTGNTGNTDQIEKSSRKAAKAATKQQTDTAASAGDGASTKDDRTDKSTRKAAKAAKKQAESSADKDAAATGNTGKVDKTGKKAPEKP